MSQEWPKCICCEQPVFDAEIAAHASCTQTIIDERDYFQKLTAKYPTQSFAKLVKIKMLEKDLTRADLAKLLGVKHNTLSGWFTGKHFPEYKHLPKLAKILDVDLVVLLTVLVKSIED
jgi:ribosome-binding protein aMBF1 (putative translation factor)